MKYMVLAGVLLLTSVCGSVIADDQNSKTEAPLTLEDYDRQISILNEQIAKYDSLAAEFDRKAQRIQPRDFSQFRRAVSMREECKSLSEDLKKHLATLEQERENLAKETSPSK
jgi:hypothetical protein